MNIFYLSNNQEECAKWHMDRHCVKMILEYAQLLSTAHKVLDGHEVTVKTDSGKLRKILELDGDINSHYYKATHINHPSAIWARQSVENYKWLATLLEHLCHEYTYRYGKVHKVEASGMLQWLLKTPKNILKHSFTQPLCAMDSDYKISSDAITNYQNYYIRGKAHLAKWKNREIPTWYHT